MVDRFHFINRKHSTQCVYISRGDRTMNKTGYRQVMGALCPTLGKDCDCGGTDSDGNKWKIVEEDESSYTIIER